MINEHEIEAIACVQVYGLITDDATRTKSFDSFEKAIAWAMHEVEHAHAETPQIHRTEVAFPITRDDGKVITGRTYLAMIFSAGGPTNALVWTV